MKIKFPLKMADGAQVRTVEELRAHFDLASVLRYYDNGKLSEWLSDRYYEEETEKVEALDSSSVNFKQQLCDMFGMPNNECVDLTDISVRNKRLEHLKQYTADDAILSAIDYVAFAQEELIDLLDKDSQKIYLCGEQFNIPGDTQHVTFIGVNQPTIHILKNAAFDDDALRKLSLADIPEDCGTDLATLIETDYLKDHIEIVWNNVTFKGVKFDTHTLTVLASESDPLEAIAWWVRAAEAGNAEAQFALAKCYEDGIGFYESAEDAVKWYQSSAEQGLYKAQYMLGDCYRFGTGVEEDLERAVDWYGKAAEQGMPEAQIALSEMYEYGDGVEQSDEEAYRLLLQVAEQGWHEAQYKLGQYCRSRQKDEEAIRWLQKAADQGNSYAKSALIEIDPKRFKLSDVIICAINGGWNLMTGTKLDAELGMIDVLIHSRAGLEGHCKEVLQKYGATDVWIEPKYYNDTVIRDIKFRNIFNAASLRFCGDQIEETVRKDRGEGCVHIMFSEISAEMGEDFNKEIIPRCRDHPWEV